jgi:5S rRNA maturation endonuclease (ribonuclease M5)
MKPRLTPAEEIAELNAMELFASRRTRMMSIHELAATAELDGIPNGHAGYNVFCPLHDDDHRSATLNPGSKQAWVIRCQRADACDQDALFKAVCALKPSTGQPAARRTTAAAPRRKEKPRERGKFDRAYVYVDEQSRPLHKTLRYREPKSFAQQRYENGRWINDIKDCRRVLYHLPQVIEAVRLGKIVFVCEGEKDADNLNKLLRAAGSKATATTCAMGAEKWLPEYNQYLAGANVVILPDHDFPGQAHANQVAANLEGIARVVVTLNLPGLGNLTEKHGKDLSDWLALGNGIEELKRLLTER